MATRAGLWIAGSHDDSAFSNRRGFFVSPSVRWYHAHVSNVHRLRTTDRIFFITCNLRKSVSLLIESEYPLIIEALEESRQRLHFGLCGYVLMPDHWHALIWPRYPLTISRAIQEIKHLSARKLDQRRGTSAPTWQHQFWDRFVRHAKEFKERLEYMHMNPVRKGLVKHAAEWVWSSYRNFSLDGSHVAACPIQIDHVHLPDSYRA